MIVIVIIMSYCFVVSICKNKKFILKIYFILSESDVNLI